MPYNFVADSFHTNKLSSSEVQFYTENGRFVTMHVFDRWRDGQTGRQMTDRHFSRD